MPTPRTHARNLPLLAIAGTALLGLAIAGCGHDSSTAAYTMKLRTVPDPPRTGQVHLIFDVRDERGKPATSKSMDVTAKIPPRPPLPEMEIHQPASEETPGAYGVMLSLAARGTWSIGAAVRDGEKVVTSTTFSLAVH